MSSKRNAEKETSTGGYGNTITGRWPKNDLIKTGGIVTLLGLSIYGGVFWYISRPGSIYTMDFTGGLTLVISVAGGAVALKQWYLVRFESSLEKFYERLDASNRRLDNEAARHLLFHGSETSHYESLMYIYGELDNLDYVIQKYKSGFMGGEQAKRGINTFKARLKQRPFRELMCHFCIQNSGYCDSLHDIIYELKSEIAQEQRDELASEEETPAQAYACDRHCQGPKSGKGEYKDSRCPIFLERQALLS